jgi:hypothetical protein
LSTPPPPFDFDLLRTFVAVVDNGSFTKAGERIGRRVPGRSSRGIGSHAPTIRSWARPTQVATC